MFLSKLYRQMYAGTGISTDSARRKKSKTWARWTARQCRKLFQAKPMPELQSPVWELAFASSLIRPALLRNEHQDDEHQVVKVSVKFRNSCCGETS